MNGLAIILLTVGLIFMLGGFIFRQLPPKNINYTYGYKTKLSMRNEETWKAAFNFSTKLMIFLGFDMVIIGAASYYLYPNLGEKSVVIGLGIIILSAVLLFVLTENYLKKNFDKAGNRINLK
ncbi:MAG: SdpI family protein [Sphingobacteriales bacterium]|nr:MAG: SdpI family protein [Sphingobacteriales bacterium]